MNKQKLIRDQLDKKFSVLKNVGDIDVPDSGWVNAIRKALTMSMRQLGLRLKISAQSVKEIEEREKAGTISLKVLRQVGAALNMKFVYGFIPVKGSLAAMIESRARDLAREIVLRTSASMALEDQENRPERIEQAIAEKTTEIVAKMPRYLWD